MQSPFVPMTIDRTRAEFPELGEAWRERARRIDEALGLRCLSALATTIDVAPTGPLAGVPVVVKDTIDTADLPTTAGSVVLPTDPPRRDAWIVETLRTNGATIAAKASCSEWANFRGERSISGWSARMGIVRNPYDPTRSAGGSSSGSAVAVAAGIAPIAIGTETDGSMLCPASLNGVIGFKASPKRLDRRGVIPISATQDSLGIFSASAEDLLVVAAALGIDAERLPTEPALVVVDEALSAFHPATRARFAEALELLAAIGVRVEHLGMPPRGSLLPDDEDEVTVLTTELGIELNRYLAERAIPGLGDLADVVRANEELASVEFALFGQEHFVRALDADATSPAYLAARDRNLERCADALASALEATGAVALCLPTMDVAWFTDTLLGDPEVPAGYRTAAVGAGTSASVPMGRIGHLPVGISFSAPAGSEGSILELCALAERALAPLAGRTSGPGALRSAEQR